MDHTDQDLCSGLHNAMQRALDNGACRPECIEYISAHAPSDPMLDRIETTCIRSVFGPRADHIPVSSIKGVTGNPLAAAGPMQTVAGAMTMRQGILPPTANCTRPDPDCHLHHVVGEPREAHPACLMINTHGLGGNNTSLILEQVET
jgi:3-oxoacyl-(acyl-carrier-protein) synthase